MRKLLLFMLFSLFDLALIAQQPRIVSVTPSTGPASGLTRVIVTVKDVDLSCPAGGCSVGVRFVTNNETQRVTIVSPD